LEGSLERGEGGREGEGGRGEMGRRVRESRTGMDGNEREGGREGGREEKRRKNGKYLVGLDALQDLILACRGGGEKIVQRASDPIKLADTLAEGGRAVGGGVGKKKEYECECLLV